MHALLDLLRQGGPVMLPILALSVLLYGRCFRLLNVLVRTQQRLTHTTAAEVGALHRLRADLQEHYEREKFPIGAMIAAAPLLGLLGTVTGMIGVFDTLSHTQGTKSMEGLAHGISEVLICTESGLAVAIPAVMLLYYAHRQAQKGLHQLSRLEARALGGT